MQSKLDARARARGARGQFKAPEGGKALQRLYAYIDRRDPRMSDAVAAMSSAKAAARGKSTLTKKARAARVVLPARSFAAVIAKAANALSKTNRRARSLRAGARPVIGPPAAAPNLWQPLGPSLIPNGQTYGSTTVNVSGRVASIAVDPKDPNHILCGSAGGGIWETRDAGSTWAPRTDAMPSLAIGAIAFDPTNPKNVYAGSGEGNFYFNIGAGLYRSTDGGNSWTVAASAPFVGVGFYDLIVDPKNPKTLYAATTNGFYVSTNSGSTWSAKRAVQCWDISLDPGGGPKAEILAAFADGLFVSTTAGSSFSAVPLPSSGPARWVRLAVDRVATAPDIAYVFGSDGRMAYLWRRTGTLWSNIASLPALNITQAWYDWYVAATPDNKGQVYLGAIDTFRGDLSGSAWRWTNITTQGANSVHPDQHCLAFAPGSSRTIYVGNDGGIFRSTSSGARWAALNEGLGINEMEYLDSDPNTSKWLMAGTQDNGTIRFQGAPAWDQIAQGDGGDCGVNPFNANEIYHSFYGVSLERSVNKGSTWTRLSPPSMPALFYPPVEVFGATVAIGGNSLAVSRNAGASWTNISLGLAAGDLASAMHISGLDTIFIGTKLGRILCVSWGGTNWTVTPLSSPAQRYISSIIVDPGTPKRLWITFSQIGGGVVYRSDNTGMTWANCSAGLPKIPINSVVVDPANGNQVWVGADVGVYQSTSLGSAWTDFSSGLPNAIAADLHFHKRDRVLICATRNRGAWTIAVP